MKVLVVGSGGREHTLVWKIAQSKRVSEIFCAPGNPGIGKFATCVDIPVDDIEALADFAEKNSMDLTIVGPEAPLVLGIVNEFEKRDLNIFGPNKSAAQIEGSKVFSKELMKKYNIPTGDYKVFDKAEDAIEYINRATMPLVIKAEGLAAGKGVIIVKDRNSGKQTVKDIMIDKAFGDSGNRIIVEEYLEGPEVTVLAFCDGKVAVPMVSSQDHKRVFDGNRGPNTGGMGAISPAPAYNVELAKIVKRDIIEQTLNAMANEGKPYKGVLYFGLMLTKEGPKVLEYNCRFGDPETQAVIPRLKTDLIDIVEKAILGKLAEVKINWREEPAICVVAASGGYPGHYETGKNITGLERAEEDGSIVFHAGTAMEKDNIITAGGRVLGVTALGKDVHSARLKAYKSILQIGFEGMHYRRDIGQ